MGFEVSGPLPYVPLSKTMPGAAAPLAFVFDPVPFNGVVDPIFKLGHNPDHVIAGQPDFIDGWEYDYYVLANTDGYTDGIPHHTMERYMGEYTSPDGVSVVRFRPIEFHVLRDDNTSHAARIFFDIGSGAWPSSGMYIQATPNNVIATVLPNGIYVQPGFRLAVNGNTDVLPTPPTNMTTWQPAHANQFTTTVTQNTIYYMAVQIPVACTLTGIAFYNGGTVNGSVKVALYNSAGTLVASSAAATQVNAFNNQQVPFSGTYAAAAGMYFVAMASNSATATFNCCTPFAYAGKTASGYTTIPTPITPPAVSAWQSNIPLLSTY